MHVALLTGFISPYRAALYEELATRVDRLTVLVSQRMARDRHWSAYEGPLSPIQQRVLTFPTRWRHPSGFSEPSNVLVPVDTVAHLRRLRPDVVISGEFGFRTAGASTYCASSATPLVIWATVSQRSEEGRDRLRQRLRATLVRRADTVIVNGLEGRDYIEELVGRRMRTIKVPYTPDPASLYHGRHPSRPAFTLAYVGQLSERKAVHVLLQALAEAPRALKLLVVGDGPERANLGRLADDLGLDVEFLGVKQPEEMPDVWRRADALVFPTLADEWGLVTNEALHSGVPVIGSVWAQSVNELVVDGSNGWRFDPEDPNSLSERITDLCALSATDMDAMRGRCRDTAGLVTPEQAASLIAEECYRLAAERLGA